VSGPSPDDFRAKVLATASTPATGAPRKWTMMALRKLQSSAAQAHASGPFDTPTANMANSMKSSRSHVNWRASQLADASRQ
jgi:hypothetical protein